MALPPSSIPASASVTNLLTEPLGLPGIQTLAANETRTITMSAFGLSQRSLVWNALYNAKLKGYLSSAAVTFDVEEIATGHQGSINRGGQGVGGSTVPVAGGLVIPDTATVTNELDDPLSVAGIDRKSVV